MRRHEMKKAKRICSRASAESGLPSASASGSAKGFVEPGPDPERFKPTPEEQAMLQRLLDWQEASAKCTLIFGPSLTCPKCGQENNPNHIFCYVCRAKL